MQFIALAIAFILELIAFVSFAALGLLAPADKIVRGILVVVLLGVVVTFWSLYMAPQASMKLDGGLYYLAKATIYLIALIPLYVLGQPAWAGAFALAVIIDEAFLYGYQH